MTATLQTPLEIRDAAGKGRGVFANRSYLPGEVITEDPIVEITHFDWPSVKWSFLKNYHFDWGPGAAAIAFGPVSMMNHSYTPNARFDPDIDRRRMVVRAVRSIEPGGEITVNYGGDPDARDPLPFEVRP